jgi:hypothetical protein
MRARIVSLAAAAMLLILLVACKKREEPARIPPPTQAVSVLTNNAPVEPPIVRVELTNVVPPPEARTESLTNLPPKGITLKLQWPVSTRYVYRMDVEQNSTNRLPQLAEPRIEHVTMGVTYAVSIVGQETNGTRQVELEFLAYELEMKADGHTLVEFDSGRSVTNATPDPLASTLRKLIGPKVHLQISADGAEGQVIGLSEWLKTIGGEGNKPAEQILTQQFNQGFFQQVTDFGKGLPTYPIHEGDSWPYRVEVPAGALGTIVANSTITVYRLEQRDQQTFAVLQSKGTLKGLPGPSNPNAVSLEKGTLTSTAWIDPELGAVMDSTVEQSMELRAEPPAPPGGTAPGVIISQIGQKVAVMLVEVGKRTQ